MGPSISRISALAVIATAFVIDISGFLRVNVAVLVILTLLLGFAYESVVRKFGQWLASANEKEAQLRAELDDEPILKGPLPTPEPEAAPVAEPEEPVPATTAPPKPVPDWERLAKEPAYKRRYTVLGVSRLHQAVRGRASWRPLPAEAATTDGSS